MRVSVFLFSFLIAIGTFAGSVSGGGGGVAYPDPTPIEADEMILLVKASKPRIWDYFKGLGHYPRPRTNEILNNGSDVFDVLDKATIVISKIGCTDFSGNVVDASINTNYRYGVCLDITSLQKKLSRENFGSQLMALIVHEISHHLGADEGAAEEIQKESLRNGFVGTDIGSFGIDSYANSFKHPGKELDESFARHIEDLVELADSSLTELVGISTRLRGPSPPVCFSGFEFMGYKINEGGNDLGGSTLLTASLKEKWAYSANWSTLLDIHFYTCDNNRTKYKSNIDAATAVESVADDIREYIRQIKAFNREFNIIE